MKIINYSILFFVIFLCLTCKKKTTIEVSVFSYALNEFVADAKVVLVERKESGTFSSNSSCHEIASAITDANGKCSFDKEKLKTRSVFQYYVVVSEIYGQVQNYPCGGKTSGFIKPGETIEKKIDAGSFAAHFKIQYNNIFDPALPGDSIFVSIKNPEYQVPDQPYPFGGGGVFLWFSYYNGTNAEPVFFSDLQKTDAGKNTVHIRKRKMGVVSTYVDTVKIYPYETKTIEINW